MAETHTGLASGEQCVIANPAETLGVVLATPERQVAQSQVCEELCEPVRGDTQRKGGGISKLGEYAGCPLNSPSSPAPLTCSCNLPPSVPITS